MASFNCGATSELDAQEVWRSIAGFDGIYEVSNHGNVRSLARTRRHWVGGMATMPPRMMVPELTNRGYTRACLTRNNARVRELVHRLVAQAFLPPSASQFINHKDGDKTNNCVSNLEWVTAGENTRHAWKTGLCSALRGQRHGGAVLTEGDIVEIRHEREQGAGLDALAKRFGVTESNICMITKWRTWRHLLAQH